MNNIRTFNIAIVDDDKSEIDLLSSIINEYASLAGIDLVLHPFGSGEEFLSVYRPYRYTAIFMDIYMDGMDGIDCAREVLAKDRGAIVIFLTSSDGRMPDAFSIHAYDYIPKPATRERVFKVLDDVMMRQTAISSAPALTFSCDKKDITLPYPKIVCVRTGKHNYLEITDSKGDTYLTRATFSEVADSLSKDSRFLLVLRGVLVNMDYIKEMAGEICHLTSGMTLPISVKNAKNLASTWHNYVLDGIRAERKIRRTRNES